MEYEAQVQNAAVAAAEKYLALANTRNTSGVTSYLEVTTARSAALSDEVTAVNILGRRMVDAVTLVQALGGGWNSSELPQRPECCGKLTTSSKRFFSCAYKVGVPLCPLKIRCHKNVIRIAMNGGKCERKVNKEGESDSSCFVATS